MLALGMYTGEQWLAVTMILLVLPMLRMVVGDVRSEPVIWREGLSVFLHALPKIYALALFSAIGFCAWMLRHSEPLTPGKLFAFSASLWATLLAATVPAHELIHRPDLPSQRLGRWLAGVAGYPILGQEHVGHHRGHSKTEWPLAQENIYGYSIRQLGISIKTVLERDTSTRTKKGQGILRGELFEAVLATLLTAAVFAFATGVQGLAMYAAVVVSMFFSMQLLAYIQHWGLGEASGGDTLKQQVAWEDACMIQAWFTLNLVFHESHHRAPGKPFYRLGLSKNSPRLPAGYVIMMVAALFPPLWRFLMVPALKRWQTFPTKPVSAGRKLLCVNLSSLRQTASDSDESTHWPNEASALPPTTPK
jgi:fatty acid desaturase